MLGVKGHKDFYGNPVPARTEVKAGTPGSFEFVVRTRMGGAHGIGRRDGALRPDWLSDAPDLDKTLPTAGRKPHHPSSISPVRVISGPCHGRIAVVRNNCQLRMMRQSPAISVRVPQPMLLIFKEWASHPLMWATHRHHVSGWRGRHQDRHGRGAQQKK